MIIRMRIIRIFSRMIIIGFGLTEFPKEGKNVYDLII